MMHWQLHVNLQCVYCYVIGDTMDYIDEEEEKGRKEKMAPEFTFVVYPHGFEHTKH